MTEYVPTLCFGLHKDYEKRIYQMWVDDLGNIDWRPLPLINVNEVKRERPARKPAEVYLVPDDPNDREDG